MSVKVYNIENFAIAAADTKELLTNVVTESDFLKLEARCKELQQWFDWQKCSSHFNLLVQVTEENRILKAKLEKATEQLNLLACYHSTKLTANEYIAILDRIGSECKNTLKELDSIE